MYKHNRSPLADSPSNSIQKPGGTPVYLTYEELSGLTGISQSTLRRRVKDGTLPFFQPGGRRTRVVFPADAVERIIRAIPLPPEVDLPPSPKTTHRGPAPKWLRDS
jgi:excisionase family DNA binding protein